MFIISIILIVKRFNDKLTSNVMIRVHKHIKLGIDSFADQIIY